MSSLLHRLSAIALVCGLAVATTGCKAGYDHTDITGARPSDLGGNVDESYISVPAGLIVTAHIVSYNSDGNIMTMSIRPHDPSVVDVVNVISNHDFAFFGLKPGTTDVDIYADNTIVLTITATVNAQPAQ